MGSDDFFKKKRERQEHQMLMAGVILSIVGGVWIALLVVGFILPFGSRAEKIIDAAVGSTPGIIGGFLSICIGLSLLLTVMAKRRIRRLHPDQEELTEADRRAVAKHNVIINDSNCPLTQKEKWTLQKDYACTYLSRPFLVSIFSVLMSWLADAVILDAAHHDSAVFPTFKSASITCVTVCAICLMGFCYTAIAPRMDTYFSQTFSLIVKKANYRQKTNYAYYADESVAHTLSKTAKADKANMKSLMRVFDMKPHMWVIRILVVFIYALPVILVVLAMI